MRAQATKDFEENNFCSFEACKALNSVGFDEGCIGITFVNREITETGIGEYTVDKEIFGRCFYGNVSKGGARGSVIFEGYPMPLFQQAIRWLRDTHKVYAEVCSDGLGMFEMTVSVWDIENHWWNEIDVNFADTEPEAYNAIIINSCGIIKEREQHEEEGESEE